MQVALYHLMDNAVKYAEQGTTISISFTSIGEDFRMTFEMESLSIDDDEFEKIFDDGFSGRHPRLVGSAGDGCGMGVVRDLLHLNNATIAIVRGSPRPPKAVLAPKKLLFSSNRFVIEFDRGALIATRARS